MKLLLIFIYFFLLLNVAGKNIREKRSGGTVKKEEISESSGNEDKTVVELSGSSSGSHSAHPSPSQHSKLHPHVSKEHGANMHRTNVDNLIFTAFPTSQTNYIYNFEGIFHPKRIDQLIYIAENIGSIQSNDVLQFKEFDIIRQVPHIFEVERKGKKLTANEIREIYLKAEKNLVENLDNFKRNNPELANADVENLDEISDKFVLKCKQFMRKLHSERGEGSLLDIFTFWEEMKYSNLEKIFKISDIHRESVDKLINEEMWKEHLSNRKFEKEGQPIKHVIVEGAGPIGLFAAFEYFLAGMHVRLVNNRRKYIRLQMVFLDRKWMGQLRFLLGTKFDVLFNQPNSKGKIDYGDVGQLNVGEIEIVMKERLEELKKFAEKHQEFEGHLDLIYGFEFEKIVEPKRKGEKYGGKLVEVGNEENVKELPLDLLICAGGANDRIRNKYLGNPIDETKSKSYGVVVFVKGQPGEVIFDDQTVFFKIEGLKKEKEIGKFVDEQNFDNFIENSKKEKLISDNFAEKYKNLGEMVKDAGTLIVRLFENSPTIHIATINTPNVIRQFFDDLKAEWDAKIKEESGGSSSMAHHHRQQKKHKNANKFDANFVKIRDRMERKWAALVFRISLWYAHKTTKLDKIKLELNKEGDGSQKLNESENWLNFDQNPVNTSTFRVTIRSVPNAVKQMEMHGESVLIVAVGDANTSPHFMTASGLSTGRIGVENGLKILKQYKNEADYDWHQMFEEFGQKLNALKHQVVRKVLEQTDMELAETSTYDHKEEWMKEQKAKESAAREEERKRG